MGINIAFALSEHGSFEKKHFGDADKYQIHHLSNKEFNFLYEEKNHFKLFVINKGILKLAIQMHHH
jgi:hypothetical protein